MMRYVFELYTYAFATNDASGFEAIGAKDCEFCSNVARDVARHAEQGVAVRNARITVERLSATEVDDHRFYGRGSIVEAPSTTADASGAVVRTEPGGSVDVEYALVWTDGR